MKIKIPLKDTKWVCIDENSEEIGMQCIVIDGEIDSDWNGENTIEIRYEDGSIAYTKVRRFMSRFKRVTD